jgi:hypothetical protein
VYKDGKHTVSLLEDLGVALSQLYVVRGWGAEASLKEMLGSDQYKHVMKPQTEAGKSNNGDIPALLSFYEICTGIVVIGLLTTVILTTVLVQLDTVMGICMENMHTSISAIIGAIAALAALFMARYGVLLPLTTCVTNIAAILGIYAAFPDATNAVLTWADPEEEEEEKQENTDDHSVDDANARINTQQHQQQQQQHQHHHHQQQQQQQQPRHSTSTSTSTTTSAAPPPRMSDAALLRHVRDNVIASGDGTPSAIAKEAAGDAAGADDARETEVDAEVDTARAAVPVSSNNTNTITNTNTNTSVTSISTSTAVTTTTAKPVNVHPIFGKLGSGILPPGKYKFRVFPPISSRHRTFVELLEANFPRFLELADYGQKPNTWRDLGTYDDVKVQEYTSSLSSLFPGGGTSAMLCRGYRTMPLAPDTLMSLLWHTDTKSQYDMMTESVQPLEHVNNHVKLERQVYRGFGVCSHRYITIAAGWQRVLFADTHDHQDTSGKKTSSEYFQENPDFRAAWGCGGMELLGLYDRTDDTSHINTNASIPARAMARATQNTARASPPLSLDGLEYTGDGIAMLAMSVGNYSHPSQNNQPAHTGYPGNQYAANPRHVEATLRVGGFLLRGVRIPRDGSRTKLLGTLPTRSAGHGDAALGCEVVGMGAVDLNGKLPAFIKTQVAKRQPTGVSNAIKLLGKRDKRNGKTFLENIDETFLHA